MKKTIGIGNCIKAVAAMLMLVVFSQFNVGAQATKTSYEHAAPRAGVTAPPAGFLGVGPVVSGSVDYSSLPSKARKFLQKHCDGHAVVRCEKEFTSGDFKIARADGIEMQFDSKGRLTDITAPRNYSLAPVLLKAVVPGKLYHLLDHNGFKSSVEGVHHDSEGYRLDVADPVFHQVCYDPSGVLTLIVDR